MDEAVVLQTPLCLEQVPQDPFRALSKQLQQARELALFGAEALACEVCASVMLDRAMLLARSTAHKRAFIECLLLLGMTNLLARTLRATDGVEVSMAEAAGPRADSFLLALSNGSTVRLDLPGPGAGRAERDRFATNGGKLIVQAAERDPALAPIRIPSLTPPPRPRREKHVAATELTSAVSR